MVCVPVLLLSLTVKVADCVRDSFLSVPCWEPSSEDYLIGTDDSSYGAGRWRPRRLSIFHIQHVQIFQPGAGVEQDYRITSGEEAAGEKFLVGDQGCSALGRGEDALDLRPVTSSGKNFYVGGGERQASTFLQDVEDQVIAIGFGNAQA